MTRKEKDFEMFFDESSEIDREKLQELGVNLEDLDDQKNVVAGTSSLVYFVDGRDGELVVKKGKDVDPALTAEREYAFLKLLKMRGGEKFFPDVYYYNNVFDVLISEKIQGEKVSGEFDDHEIEEIAEIVSKLHKPEFSRPGLPGKKREEKTQYEYLIEQTQFLEKWYRDVQGKFSSVGISGEDIKTIEKVKQRLLGSLSESEESFQNKSFSLIHYDLNPENIVKTKDGKMVILDWRQASIGDRAMDVAKLFMKSNFSQTQKKLFLEKYEDTVKDSTIEKRIDVYYPLIRLASLLWRVRFMTKDVKRHPEVGKGINRKLFFQRMSEDIDFLKKIN